MPLFDYRCELCDDTHTLLLKHGEAAICPACGGKNMTKLLTPFAFAVGGSGATRSLQPAASQKSAAKPVGVADATGHVHGPGCGHGPAVTGCASAARADALVKKYLD